MYLDEKYGTFVFVTGKSKILKEQFGAVTGSLKSMIPILIKLEASQNAPMRRAHFPWRTPL